MYAVEAFMNGSTLRVPSPGPVGERESHPWIGRTMEHWFLGKEVTRMRRRITGKLHVRRVVEILVGVNPVIHIPRVVFLPFASKNPTIHLSVSVVFPPLDTAAVNMGA